MTDQEILAAADAIRKKQAPEYTERAASIAELEDRLSALKAEQAAVDAEAEQAKAKLSGPKASPDVFQIPRAGETWTPRDDHDIFAVEPERYELPEDETATAKPNGGLSD